MVEPSHYGDVGPCNARLFVPAEAGPVRCHGLEPLRQQRLQRAISPRGEIEGSAGRRSVRGPVPSHIAP